MVTLKMKKITVLGMKKMNKNALEVIRKEVHKKERYSKRASGGYVSYDTGINDYNELRRTVLNIMKEEFATFFQASTREGGADMSNDSERLFREIDEIKQTVKETNAKVIEIDKKVAVLDERSQHTATKAFVLITGIGTVLTILGSIFGLSKFFGP